MDINWDGLMGRNLFADFVGGAQAGEEMRQRAAKQKAMNLFATDPVGAEKALIAAGDFNTAEALAKRRERERETQTRAAVGAKVAAGDLTGARTEAANAGALEMVTTIAQMDKTQRELLKQQTGTLAAAVFPLRGKSPQEIAAMWPQIKASLARYQIDPEKLAFDPTQPGAIEALIAESTELSKLIDQANADRDFGLRKEQFGETKRSNQVSERQRGEQLGISRGQLGVAQSNASRGWAAHNARLKAGGYGTPGVGVSGVVPDEDVEID